MYCYRLGLSRRGMLSSCLVERHNVLLATCAVRNSEEAAYVVSTFIRQLKLKTSLEGIDLSYDDLSSLYSFERLSGFIRRPIFIVLIPAPMWGFSFHFQTLNSIQTGIKLITASCIWDLGLVSALLGL
jgi:hypothetical protein